MWLGLLFSSVHFFKRSLAVVFIAFPFFLQNRDLEVTFQALF